MAPGTELGAEAHGLSKHNGVRSPVGGPPSGEGHTRGRRVSSMLIPLLVIAAIVISCLLIPVHPETDYPFIKAYHPIDVGTSGGGRWFYYLPDTGGMTPDQLAMAARKYLNPRSYVEDTSNRPWFRFVKGGREVIVCNHDEIATAPTSWAGWRIFHGLPPRPNLPHENWPVVWVREPTPNPAGLLRFKLQKYARGW